MKAKEVGIAKGKVERLLGWIRGESTQGDAVDWILLALPPWTLPTCLLAYLHQASLNCLAPELYLLCPMCTPLNCLVQLYLTCTHSRSQPRLFAIRCPSYSHFGNFNLSTVTLVLFIWIWQKWNHLPHFVETSLILFQSWQECRTTTTSQRW